MLKAQTYDANKARQNTDYDNFISDHLGIAAMLEAILKIQIHELGANVVKILYAKNPVEIWKIKHWSAASFNIVAMLVAILKIQVHGLGAKV